MVANAQQQNGNVSGETTTTSSVPCNSNSNLDRVKTKPGGTCGEGSDGYELFGIYCKLPPYKSRTASVFLGSASYLRGSLSASEGEKKTEG